MLMLIGTTHHQTTREGSIGGSVLFNRVQLCHTKKHSGPINISFPTVFYEMYDLEQNWYPVIRLFCYIITEGTIPPPPPPN